SAMRCRTFAPCWSRLRTPSANTPLPSSLTARWRSEAMRPVLFIFGICCLVLAGCSSPKPQELIVGKWDREDKDLAVIDEFTKDGKLTTYINGTKLQESKYNLSDDGLLECTFEDGFKVAYKINVTKDELTMTLTSGNKDVIKHKRAK